MYWIILLIVILISTLYQLNSINKINLKLGEWTIKLDTKIIWCILISLPFILTAYYRDYSVGTDTQRMYYSIYYQGYAVNNWHYSLYEFLFIWLIKLGYRLGGTFDFELLLISILTVGFMFISFLFRKERINLIVASVLYGVFLFLPSMNIMRQLLAVSIAFFGVKFIEKNDVKKFLLIELIACFIHSTSIAVMIYLIPYLLRKVDDKIKRIVVLIFLGSPVIINWVFNSVMKVPLFAKFASFIREFDMNTVQLKFLIPQIFVLPLIILNYKKLVKADHNNFLHICASFCILGAIYLSGYLWYAFRVLFFFLPSEIVILSQIGALYKTKIIAAIVNIYFIAIAILNFYLLYVYWGADSIFPYVIREMIKNSGGM